MPYNKKKHSLTKAFSDAFRGLCIGASGRNFRIHIFIAFIVVITGIFFKIPALHWMILLLLFALVISLELINTAIEKLADVVDPEINAGIRDVKDIAASAVLWSVMVSILIGFIIFVPEIFNFLNV